jgi:hypothetical protein
VNTDEGEDEDENLLEHSFIDVPYQPGPDLPTSNDPGNCPESDLPAGLGAHVVMD